MRNYSTVSPQFWQDHLGRVWKVPEIKGRLKHGKCPGHAALREFVIERDEHRSQICGKHEGEVSMLVADHIISRRNGGSHHPDNLQCLCDSCNARKAVLVDAKKGHDHE